MKQTILFLILLGVAFSMTKGQTYYQLPDIASGNTSAQHYGVVGEIGGKMLFRVRIGSSSVYQLWVADATTAQIKKLMDGYVELYWSQPFLADGKLYFYSKPEELSGPVGGVYSYDGEELELVVADEPRKMTWFQDKVFYIKNTVLFDSVALYHATDDPTDPQWVKGFNHVNMVDLVTYNGELIIMAGQDGDTYLFRSNGTTAGTVPIVHLGEDSNTSTPVYFTEKNGKLYFQYRSNAASPPPIGLYKTDGTAAGTVRLRDLYTRSGSVTPTDGFEPQYIWRNDTIYTSGNSPDHPNVELWLLDAANDSTDFVVDVNGNANTHSHPRRFVELNGVIYFTASISNNKPAIFRTDGTAAGTNQVLANVFAGPSARYGEWLTVYDGKLAFRGRTQSDGTYSQLWFSDGTDAGTYKATNVFTGSDYAPTNLYAMGGLLFYSAYSPSQGTELWVYNNGTVPIIQGSLLNIGCNDNGTASNLTDDYIVFDLTVTGLNLSSGFLLSSTVGAPEPSNGVYGVSSSYQLPIGSAGEGDVFLTINDAVNTSFGTELTILDPGICSATLATEDKLSSIEVLTFPNPFDEAVSFKLTNYQGHSKLELQIFSPLGKRLKVLPFEHNDTVIWNPGTLPSGVYYVFVKNMLTDAFIYRGIASKK